MKLFFNTLILTLAMLSLCSCDAVYDSLGDTSAQYRMRFIDDVNLKFADAFDSEVQSITLSIFDENGYLVATHSADADSIEKVSDDHSLDISDLAPGKYHVVAWGGVHDESSYVVSQLSRDATHISDFTCRLNRENRENEMYDLVEDDINDLFHGSTDIEIPDPDVAEPGVHTFDIHLTKNTHKVSVILQQLNGESLDPNDYDFTIVADNGHINYDNSIIHDEKSLIYRAYDKRAGSAGISDGSAVINNVSAIVARHTISRLVVSESSDSDVTTPTLNITTAAGDKLVSIPLIDYILMVRNNYPQVATDQDYLDRQDEYNFVFFMTNGRWLDSLIYINSWKIVLNNNDL